MADKEEQTLLNNLVVALAYQGRSEEAEAMFGSLKRPLAGSYPEFVYEATSGLMRFHRGNVQSGRLSYRRAEELAPQNRNGWALIHWAHEEEAAGTTDAPGLRTRAEESVRKSGDLYAQQIFARFLGEPELGRAKSRQ